MHRRGHDRPPGAPTAPGPGATPYQSAQYTRKLKAWQAKRAAEVSAEAAQTHGRVSAWAAGLQIGAKVRQLSDPPADEGSLAAESAVAASAQTGLAEGAGMCSAAGGSSCCSATRWAEGCRRGADRR